jgi:hypothetical protein
VPPPVCICWQPAGLAVFPHGRRSRCLK